MAVKQSMGSFAVYLQLGNFDDPMNPSVKASEEILIENKHILSLYFIEDIFSYFMCGKITFKDKNLIGEFGPITGNERIKIVYGVSEAGTKEVVFSVYKIADIDQFNYSKPAESAIYTFYFVEKESFIFGDRQFSTSWPEKTPIMNIVKDVFKEMVKLDPEDKTIFRQFEDANDNEEEQIDFCMPYWTPRQAINWLLKRTSSKESGNSGYLFYSNTENLNRGTSDRSFNLVTLEKLLSQQQLLSVGAGDNGIYTFYDRDGRLVNKIFSYSINGPDRAALYKIVGGRKIGYNPIACEFLDTEEELDYKKMIDKTTVLGKASLYTDISQHTYTTDSEWDPTLGMLKNIYYDEWIKRYVNQNVVSVTVEGHEKRYAGAMIEIDWASAGKNSNLNEVYNKLYTGKWLIKSITHNFTQGNPYYTQKLVLIKNGYEEKPSKASYLMDASKTNTASQRSQSSTSKTSNSDASNAGTSQTVSNNEQPAVPANTTTSNTAQKTSPEGYPLTKDGLIDATKAGVNETLWINGQPAGKVIEEHYRKQGINMEVIVLPPGY